MRDRIKYMFKKESREEMEDKIDTIIGPSVKLEGDFSSLGNIIINGIVGGSLKTTQSLKVGDKAEIKANVQAKSIIVAGKIEGAVLVENNLIVLSTAQITGDITCGMMSIEQGAIINGKCTMRHKEGERAKEEPVEKVKEELFKEA